MLLCITSALLVPAAFSAEPPWPGVYRGTFHVDRWLEPRLVGASELSIPADIAKRLQPYARRPIAVDVSRLGGHPLSPSKATIREVKSIRELPQPVSLKLRWAGGREQDDASLWQIRTGEQVEICVTVRNLSSEPLSLDPSPMGCGLYRVRPAGGGKRDPLEYQSGLETASFNLTPENRIVDVVKAFPGRLPAPRLGLADMLGLQESREFTFTLASIPANEYEISVNWLHYSKSKEYWISVRSNWLRLDVLDAEPRSWQGLQVTLEPDHNRQSVNPGGFPMRVRFANTGDRALRFNLLKYRGDRVISDDLVVCYDEHGTLLPVATPGTEGRTFFRLSTDPQTSVEQVRLEPGKDLVIPVELPAAARTARAAFRHRFSLEGRTKPDEIAFEGLAYAFSPHVLLESRQADRSPEDDRPPRDNAPVEAPRPERDGSASLHPLDPGLLAGFVIALVGAGLCWSLRGRG